MRQLRWLLLFLASSPGAAQDILHAEICELLQHPEIFAGKMIAVQANVAYDFEDFEITIPSCNNWIIDGIWLEYGRGPRKQPTTWCCGDLASRDELELVLNSAFRNFDRRVRARRKGTPRYSVSATFQGRFDAVATTTCPDGIHRCPQASGYGHFGVFASRLVIQSVSNVSFVRSQQTVAIGR